MSALNELIARAKAAVIATGKAGVYRYICREDGPEVRSGLVTMDACWYQETGREEDCVAVVWSYADGRYDKDNKFRENGKIAATVERYE